MGWCTILAGVLHLKGEVKIAHRCGGWEECGDTFGSRSVSQLLTARRDSGGIYASHLLAARGEGEEFAGCKMWVKEYKNASQL